MKTSACISLGAFVFSVATCPLAAQDLATPLQQGLFEEEANRDLPAAIQAYQAVLTQFDQQRKLAATAVFRLGECYRKLGQTNEAVAHYQRVLSDFPDQAPLLQASRDHLASLGAAPANPAPASRPSLLTLLPDEEETAIRRYEAMLKESPDLLNAWINPTGMEGTPLHQAARKNQLRVAKFLLENQADINSRDAARQTPLHVAVATANKNMVELLLEHGAEVEARNNEQATPLHEAAWRGFNAIAEVLLSHDAHPDATARGGQTPLYNAAQKGHRVLVETLLDHKANVDAGSNLGGTPLLVAVAAGQLPIAELLLDRGASVQATDNSGNTALHMVSQTKINQADLTKLLLARGADVNATDREGNTPLHNTARNGDEEVIPLLLAAKPDLETRNQRGETPLWTALLSAVRSPETVRLLLDAGASPDSNLGNYSTPLHYVVERLDPSLLKSLLEHQANPNVTVRTGLTPLSMAKQVAASNDSQKSPTGRAMAQLLLDHGADENLQRRSLIMVQRGNWTQAVFYRGTNTYNHYTLYELLTAVDMDPTLRQQLAFPDFNRLRVLSPPLDGAAAALPRRANSGWANLEARLNMGDCDLNSPLDWGDIVEIPEADHRINETWTHLPDPTYETFQKCLQRRIPITVGGNTTLFTLRPLLPRMPVEGMVIALPAGAPRPPKRLDWSVPTVFGFRLKEVLFDSNLLLTSSDLSRVKVTRMNPATGEPVELHFDLSNPDPAAYDERTDLWLREGDAIEVP